MKRRRTILVIGLVLLVSAGGLVAWRLWPRKRVTVTDARNIRTPAADARVRDVLWDKPQRADEILSLTGGSTDYAIDAEGRRLVFVRDRGAAADVHIRERSGGRWGPASPIDAINSADGELDVALSPDGDTLVFSSDRPGAIGGFDLYISRFSNGAWGQPAPIEAANSSFDEVGAAVARHGTRLVFSTNRPIGEAPADGTTKEPASRASLLRAGDYNLYRLDLLSDAVAMPIAAANSIGDDLAPAFSPDEDFLYFASDRREGIGGFDLYRMRLLPDGFGLLERLDDTINTQADELDPVLGLSGFRLTYRSEAVGEEAPRLLQSTSREVYRDVSYERGTIDWAALWRQIAPNLMWALLALILMLLFFAMMRDFRDRKVNLMARCLLASLLAHLVLMLLFNVVKVSTTIASAIGGRDRIRVSLMSEASAGEIWAQIRGEFVDVDTVAAEVAPAEQAALESEPIETHESVEIAPQSSEMPTETPVDAKLTRFDAHDARRDVDVPEVRMASALPELDASFTQSTFDDVELPEPAAAEAEHEPAAPAGVSLVGEPRLEAPIAAARSPTSQPALAMAIEIGVATSTEIPSDTDATEIVVAVNDAASDDHESSFPGAQASSSVSAPSELLAVVDVAIPGESAAKARGDQSESGVAVASFTVEGPARAALDTPESSNGGEIVELAVIGATTLKDGDGTKNAEPDDVHDSTAVGLPASPPRRAPSSTDATSQIELAIGLPGNEPATPNDRESPASDSELAAVTMPEVPGITSALPSANEALAESRRGSVALVTTGPESDSAWVTANATRATRESRAEDDATTSVNVTSDVTDNAEVPFVWFTIGVGVPEAPKPTGIHRGMIGRIVGTVEDAETGRGLGGARVLLVLQDEQSIVAATDDYGSYEIQVPPVPDHFALSASRGGFVPESRNIDAAAVRGKTLTVNFALSRQTELVIALENEPDVHHLGNDRFQGQINSQFQKHAEGRTFRASFEVTRDQMPPNYTRAELIMMVKGVQCPHQVRINGRLLSTRLADAPRDGSFGEFRAAFDPGWLIEGENQFRIRARMCSGDVDDFEFVNIQIRLRP